MCRKAVPRLHGARKIVVLVADVWRGVLQHSGDQADLLRRIHRYEGRSCAAEVVKTHRFAEPFREFARERCRRGYRQIEALPGTKPIARRGCCLQAGAAGSPLDSAADRAASARAP